MTRQGAQPKQNASYFIRGQGLLPEDEIDQLIRTVPEEIIENQQLYARGFEIPEWYDFLEAFTVEDGVDVRAETQP